MNNSTSASARSSSGNRYVALLVFVVLCFSVAAVGSLFPPDEWYRSLKRPSYAPPNWVFGPVWTVLYFTMAVSGWLIWKSVGPGNRRYALAAFGVQLLLNGAWSAIFFGWHKPGFAFIEICVLSLAILTTIMLSRRHSRVAAFLLLPYLLWVSFAAVLNYGFWSLN